MNDVEATCWLRTAFVVVVVVVVMIYILIFNIYTHVRTCEGGSAPDGEKAFSRRRWTLSMNERQTTHTHAYTQTVERLLV